MLLLHFLLLNFFVILINADISGIESFATTNRPKAYKASTGEFLNIDINDPVKVVNSMYFKGLITNAEASSRKRRMTDLTKDPSINSMQVLMNTWTEGSYSPVHRHNDYSEAFVILDGALAFFTFTEDGQASCHVISHEGSNKDKAIIIEAKQYHAMTAAPTSLGYPGYAIVFEISGHMFESNRPTKSLAAFAPSLNDGLDGDPAFYKKILQLCPSFSN